MIKLYDNPLSGNCFKVKLLLVQSKIPFESIMIDVLRVKAGESHFYELTMLGKFLQLMIMVLFSMSLMQFYYI